MALGPGKYDDLATAVREQAHAEGIVLVVIGGDHGGGMAAQLPAAMTLTLPTILRTIADEIEAGWPRA